MRIFRNRSWISIGFDLIFSIEIFFLFFSLFCFSSVSLDISPINPTPFTTASSGYWTQITPTSSISPVTRYGHTSGSTKNFLIITHGYYYSTSKGEVWLSDTWQFIYDLQEWKQLITGCENIPLSHSNSNERERKSCPIPRMGASGVMFEENLFMYGGDDGGHSKGENSYSYNIIDDLWKFSSHSFIWTPIPTILSFSSLASSGYISDSFLAAQSIAHAQHTAAIITHRTEVGKVTEMYVFGGITPRKTRDNDDSVGSKVYAASNELFVLSFENWEWKHIPCTNPPASRFASAIASSPFLTTNTVTRTSSVDWYLYVYGGMRKGEGNFGDLWRLELKGPLFHSNKEIAVDECNWVQVAVGAGETPLAIHPPPLYSHVLPLTPNYRYPAPASRIYASLLSTSTYLLLFGGAHCSPGCTTSSETWAYDFYSQRWRAVRLSSQIDINSVGDRPESRYKHSLTMSGPSTEDEVEEYLSEKETIERLKEGGREEDKEKWRDFYLFGGESYSPQSYHNDLWHLQYWHDGDGKDDDNVVIEWMKSWKKKKSIKKGENWRTGKTDREELSFIWLFLLVGLTIAFSAYIALFRWKEEIHQEIKKL